MIKCSYCQEEQHNELCTVCTEHGCCEEHCTRSDKQTTLVSGVINEPFRFSLPKTFQAETTGEVSRLNGIINQYEQVIDSLEASDKPCSEIVWKLRKIKAGN